LAAKEWIATKWMEIDYDYLRTGTAIGFRASHELCSNYLLLKVYKFFLPLNGNLSQSYRASPAIGDHAVLPATQHRWTCPVLALSRQVGTQFTYPSRIEGWVNFGDGLAVCSHLLGVCETHWKFWFSVFFSTEPELNFKNKKTWFLRFGF